MKRISVPLLLTFILSRFQSILSSSIDAFEWDVHLITPGYIEDPIEDGVGEFVTVYNISDRHYEIEVFQTDCVTSTDGLPLVTTVDTKAGGTNQFEALFQYNQSTIQNSNIWTSNTTGGNAHFCMKVTLYSSNETDGILFNFHETIYEIQVDLLAGFSLNVEVQAKDNAEQNGLLDFVPGFFDGQFFATNYQVVDKEHDYAIYKTDCKTRLSPASAFPLHNSTESVTDGVKDIELKFVFNPTLLQSSNLFNLTDSTLNFCLRLVLLTETNNGLQTTFQNLIDTEYSININSTDPASSAINIGSTTTTGFGFMAVDLDENITAYQCDDNFNVLTSMPALTQGDSLQICVETEDGSAFEVGGMDVTVEQNGTKTFDYVSSFVDSYWSKSSCIATRTSAAKCKVKMQLLGAYFMDDNPDDLTVSGMVKMDYLGRRLSLAHDINKDRAGMINERNLQGVSAAVFTLDVGIASKAGASTGTSTSSTPDSPTNENLGFTVGEENSGGRGKLPLYESAILTSLITLFTASYLHFIILPSK